MTAGGIFLIAFSVFQFVCIPAVDRLERQKRILQVQDESIARMRRLAKEYQTLSLQFDEQKRVLTQRPADFTLFSFLDTQAQKSGVKKHVAYMKPYTQDADDKEYSLSKVKVKLKEVYAKGLIYFLSGVESSGNGVEISSLSLNKSGKNGRFIDAVVETQTLMTNEASAR